MLLEWIWGATCRQFTNHCWSWLEKKTSRLYPSSTSQPLRLTQKVLSRYFLESTIWALSSIHRQLKKWMRGSRPISDDAKYSMSAYVPQSLDIGRFFRKTERVFVISFTYTLLRWRRDVAKLSMYVLTTIRSGCDSYDRYPVRQGAEIESSMDRRNRHWCDCRLRSLACAQRISKRCARRRRHPPGGLQAARYTTGAVCGGDSGTSSRLSERPRSQARRRG